MTTKTTIIHHSADYDGIFCREIAKKFLPDAKVIGWDFGDPPIAIPDGPIYVLDLPVDRVFGFKFSNDLNDISKIVEMFNGTEGIKDFNSRLVWIDHHKSSIDSHPTDIPGYRIDGVAACRLAWQWFSLMQQTPNPEEFGLPFKEHYVDRKVSEPLAVRLAGEYDIWDKRDPRAELFQHGLRSRDLTNDWGLMLSPNRKMTVSEIESLMDVGHDRDLLNPDGTTDSPTVLGLLDAGRGIQYAQTKQNESIIKELGFTFQWEGLTFLACNHARYNSFLFTAGLNPEHDACFGFKFTGHCAGGKPFMQWSISLYHAPGKEHHDLSKIAVKYGGGGHRGACGFQTSQLPFLTC